jgi:hypothetical protein
VLIRHIHKGDPIHFDLHATIAERTKPQPGSGTQVTIKLTAVAAYSRGADLERKPAAQRTRRSN